MLGVLVLVHELGHFLVARRAGVLCHEFSIGFGPKLYSWKPGETQFSLRAIPLGGYVLMAGEIPGESGKELMAEPGRNLNEKSVWTRMSIAAAGSFTNFLLAIVLFFIIFSLLGIPTPTLVLDHVEPGLPADQAGLEAGDRVIALNGEPVESWMEVVFTVRDHLETPVIFTVERNNQIIENEVVPQADPDQGHPQVGIASQVETIREPVLTALWEAIKWTGEVLVLLVVTLTRMITGREGADQLIGVVGMGAEVGRAAQMGLANVLALAGSISASLGFINLLPIPALDGSRLVYLVIERISGKPLDPEKEGLINLIGFVLLILLAIYVTFQDITRLTG